MKSPFFNFLFFKIFFFSKISQLILPFPKFPPLIFPFFKIPYFLRDLYVCYSRGQFWSWDLPGLLESPNFLVKMSFLSKLFSTLQTMALNTLFLWLKGARLRDLLAQRIHFSHLFQKFWHWKVMFRDFFLKRIIFKILFWLFFSGFSAFFSL